MRRVLLLVPLLLVGVLAAPATAAPAPPPSDRWALLVGVNHFLGRTRPNTGAVGDVNEVRDVLIANGWPADHIRVLTDSGANAADIRDGLRWLVDNSSDSSFSVFYYSGHVKQEGSTEYIWPHDNQFISDSELAGSLTQLRGWAWVNFSGCEAAGFDEGISSPRRLVTASSQSSEKSYELPPEVGRSVFTSLLVDQGIAAKAADANNDGQVSLQEAFAYAAGQAPGVTAGESHGPQHPYMAGGDGTPWFLDGVATPPPPPPPKTCLLFLCF